MSIYYDVMQLSLDGTPDTLVRRFTKDRGHSVAFMSESGYTRMKNSAIFFKKGRGDIRYTIYSVNEEPTRNHSLLSVYQKELARQ